MAELSPSGPETRRAAGHYRPDIDGLRAIAVAGVVAYHAFPRAMRGGFVGVDVFFVISGYLISGLILEDLRRGRFSYRRFYARRFRRIFPALIVILAACLLYGAVALAPDEFRELGAQVLAGAGFGSNFLQWSEAGYFDQEAAVKPLLHLWSLGVEEQFYIAWPILLVFAAGSARRMRYLFGGLMAASFAANLILTRWSPSAAFYLPLPRFWELLLGGLIAWVPRLEQPLAGAGGPPGRRAGEWRAGLGLGLIGVSLFAIDADRAFPGGWVLLPTLGTALVICAPGAWLNRVLLASPAAVLVGLISYPLYLWHWVILAFARIANDGEELPRTARLAAVAASVALAWLTYRLVESPIRFSRRRDLLPRTLIGSMALCACAAAAVLLTDGFAFRYPAQIRALAAVDYGRQKEFYERAYRGGTCFLGVRDGFAALASRCVDPAGEGRRLLVLWGDSHAASLYPGLRDGQRRFNYRIAQFTASACLPVIGYESERRPNCGAFNDWVLREIGVLAPDAVIIEAHWALYQAAGGRAGYDGAALRRTVEALERLKVPRIVVVGSLPTWRIDQPRVAFEIWRRRHVLTDRSSDYLEPAAFAADRAIRQDIAGTAATFVSPIALLCGTGGCLISTDPHAAVPVAWDNDHLSLAGSDWVASRALAPALDLEPHS